MRITEQIEGKKQKKNELTNHLLELRQEEKEAKIK